MKRFTVILIVATAVFSYVFFYMRLSSIPIASVFNQQASKLSFYEAKEKQLRSFLEKHFIKKDGSILTDLKGLGSSNDTLSESVGLLMQYSLIKEDRELFERELHFLREKMIVDGRYVIWKSGQEKVYCNALIDDLRIVRGLIAAYEEWGDKVFFDMAGFIQQGILEKQADEGRIYELYDWDNRTVNSSIPLCYLDLYTIYKLNFFSSRWNKIAIDGVYTIKRGRIGDSPFFNKYYDYSRSVYSKDEEFENMKGICLTYTLYTVLHLAEMNENTDFFTSWLKAEMDEDRLYAWYNPDNLKSSSDIESTSVYALAAIYSKIRGEDDLYHKLINRMLQFSIVDENSQYYGGFGNEDTLEFYSFDNLTALCALAMASK